MDEQTLWRVFVRTGKVEDYLRYRMAAQSQAAQSQAAQLQTAESQGSEEVRVNSEKV